MQEPQSIAGPIAAGGGQRPAAAPVVGLKDITGEQWKSGVAAWLGWLFDGLDMHLYTLVALTFVAELLHTDKSDPAVRTYGSWIQASFLIGWALGGGFFGVVGDRIGRTRALMLTILTYAMFTGLSFFAQTWWHLLFCRFAAALGIGGEWAVGASLLSETWPRRWRPWLAAVLQTGVNCGTLVASFAVFLMAGLPPRTVFLVGVLPAFLVLWIRRAVPEPEVWHAAAQREVGGTRPGIRDLFRGPTRRIAVLTLTVCALSLTAHWAFMFWHQQQLRNLPDIQGWSAAAKTRLASEAMYLVIVSSVVGNFAAAVFARYFGYRTTIFAMSLGYAAALVGAYGVPRDHASLLAWLRVIGFFQGLFALYTMYLPPLFPVLLRTTGAGFCYNIGRIGAAVGTVMFSLFATIGDHRIPLLASGFLFVPAALLTLMLPPARA